jgi:hypothetical protein
VSYLSHTEYYASLATRIGQGKGWMGKMSQRKERVVMKVITIQLAIGWGEH